MHSVSSSRESRLAVLIGLWVMLGGTAVAAPPLHEQIDRQIAAKAGGPVAEPATDAEFLRRLYLDLAGTIPTAEEARAFLADTAPDKRARLIDRLLASDDYARRMEQAFTVMLLERRVGTTITETDWQDYLRTSFAANKPWNQIVREIVAADGSDPAIRPGMKFFVDGGRNDHHQMTQDVARLFLGMDIQCAQCHDHPSVEDYKQSDYFGLYAYVKQSKLHTNPQTKLVYFAEEPATGKVDFQSVFKSEEKSATGPKLPGGEERDIPKFDKGQELAQPAKDGLPAIPRFRPRQELAVDLTSADNERFRRNAVNRFWFLMMGRGLVMPLDLDHSDNPPSHPELLKLLADDFAANGFDVKRLLREIALSQVYQRSSLVPEGVTPQDALPESYRAAIFKPLSAEQMLWSGLKATGELPTVLSAAAPENSKFTYNDYINGRITEPPSNLRDMHALFVGVFGNPPGEPEEEFAPSMGQSLFLMNERLVLRWLEPRDGNLVNRLNQLSDANAVADELYLSVFSRFPTEEERMEVAAYLDQHQQRRTTAIGELAWALLASAEFRLNH